MRNNLLVMNCSESTLQRMKTALGDDLRVMHCYTFEELRRAWYENQHAKIMIGCNGTSVSAPAAADEYRVARLNGSAACTATAEAAAAPALPIRACGTLADQVDWFERQVIAQTLERNRQHRKGTAAELGISRVTLYNKMKKFGLLDM